MRHIFSCMIFMLWALTGCNNRVSDYCEGLAVYERDGKFGYVDSTGRVAVKAQYDLAKDFSNGMGYVSKNGKWGYIDRTGKVIIPIKYDYIYGYVWDFGKTWAVVEQNGKRGFINKEGYTRGQIDYDEVPYGINNFQKGDYELVRKGDKYGVINHDYVQIIPCHYDEIGQYSGEFCSVKASGRWGYVDRTGIVKIPLRYFEVRPFQDGVATVMFANGRWGVINSFGQTICSPYFDEIGSFSDGMCWVQRNGKIGFVNTEGILSVPYRYHYAENFANGVSRVSYDGVYWGVINNRGRQIIPCKYSKDEIRISDDIEITKHMKFDKNGKLLR